MENIQRTELYQGNVWTANEAPASFDAAGHRIPLVLVPDKRYWCSCYMTIPTGAHSVMHRCGQDEAPNELAQPGLQCLPSCYYIAYCVNKKSITYNAPVKSCPSKDNVMVDCVLALVFQINPEATAVKKFIYMLGAVRFDKFLMAAVEEAIRHLIRGCQHLEVYELKGQGTSVRLRCGSRVYCCITAKYVF